eukprot:Tbor_TRINITY_DN6104_c1_g3::TRINITY_DN6104_c1_g3_i1::g.21851::m.21851
MESSIQKYQDKVSVLHVEHHVASQKLMIERNMKSNDIFAARQELIKKKGPVDFWSQLFLSHKDFKNELLGSYDPIILKSMINLNVINKSNGDTIVELSFGSNDFFSNTKLSVTRTVDGDMSFSGVEWKEGKGPLSEEEEEAAEKREIGKKGERDGAGEDRGDSFFQFFEEMEEPILDDDVDDDEKEEIMEEFQNEIDGREEIFEAIVREIWGAPEKIMRCASE